MAYFRKKELSPGWVLQQLRTSTSSYILSVPRDTDTHSVSSFLSTVPGKTKIIVEETFQGYDIYFCFDNSFNFVFSVLQSNIDFGVPPPPKNPKRPVTLYVDGQPRKTYDSMTAAGKDLGIHPSCIYGCLKKGTLYKKKYEFRPAPEISPERAS